MPNARASNGNSGSGRKACLRLRAGCISSDCSDALCLGPERCPLLLSLMRQHLTEACHQDGPELPSGPGVIPNRTLQARDDHARKLPSTQAEVLTATSRTRRSHLGAKDISGQLLCQLKGLALSHSLSSPALSLALTLAARSPSLREQDCQAMPVLGVWEPPSSSGSDSDDSVGVKKTAVKTRGAVVRFTHSLTHLTPHSLSH